jgi:hypothetical protein
MEQNLRNILRTLLLSATLLCELWKRPATRLNPNCRLLPLPVACHQFYHFSRDMRLLLCVSFVRYINVAHLMPSWSASKREYTA